MGLFNLFKKKTTKDLLDESFEILYGPGFTFPIQETSCLKALKLVEKALVLEPDNISASYSKGIIELYLGNLKEAEK